MQSLSARDPRPQQGVCASCPARGVLSPCVLGVVGCTRVCSSSQHTPTTPTEPAGAAPDQPALQTMRDDEEMRHWIVEKQMNFADACRGVYLTEYVTISHRWLTDQIKGEEAKKRAPPDPNGVQLQAIKDYLVSQPSVTYVWVDWLCMWQKGKDGQREITPAEEAEFNQMLSEVNMLWGRYLGTSDARCLYSWTCPISHASGPCTSHGWPRRRRHVLAFCQHRQLISAGR